MRAGCRESRRHDHHLPRQRVAHRGLQVQGRPLLAAVVEEDHLGAVAGGVPDALGLNAQGSVLVVVEGLGARFGAVRFGAHHQDARAGRGARGYSRRPGEERGRQRAEHAGRCALRLEDVVRAIGDLAGQAGDGGIRAGGQQRYGDAVTGRQALGCVHIGLEPRPGVRRRGVGGRRLGCRRQGYGDCQPKQQARDQPEWAVLALSPRTDPANRATELNNVRHRREL